MYRLWLLIFSVFLLDFTAVGQNTYFSRNDATLPRNWNEADSWTLNADGSGPAAAIPGRDDNVIILDGHTISINAVDDNGSPGLSADDLRTGFGYTDVGPWNNSQFVNFYHKFMS